MIIRVLEPPLYVAQYEVTEEHDAIRIIRTLIAGAHRDHDGELLVRVIGDPSAAESRRRHNRLGRPPIVTHRETISHPDATVHVTKLTTTAWFKDQMTRALRYGRLLRRE